MPDEQTLDQTQGNQEQQTTETTEQTVTLDDVYRDAGLDKLVQPQAQFQQPPPPQQRPPESLSVPDPYDTENFKAYIARQNAGTTALQEAVVNMASYLSNIQREQVASKLQADIQSAVGAVQKIVPDQDPEVIEAMLDGKARKDSRFKAIWENRGKNPSAWQNALNVVGREFAEKLSVKVDPSLVTAQRARKDAQKHMATTRQETQDESWDNLKPDDFMTKWNQMVSGGN